MNTQQAAALNEQITCADTTDNKNYLFKVHDVAETPFTVIEQEGKYFGSIGQDRITEIFENLEECIEQTKKITWARIMQVIWAIIKKQDEIAKLKFEQDE